MIDVLINKVKSHDGTQQEKYNYLRELLQLSILKKLDELGYFRNIAFVGGTALRILYDLQRFSEDLNFSLINAERFDFSILIQKIIREFNKESLELSAQPKLQKTVCSCFVKFKNLLHITGLSQHRDENIMIKIEVDKNPPLGYHTQLSMISNEYLIAINHLDLPSLYAGKLHALLQRKYTKGRDYYDYLWYMGKKIKPNLVMLNNALEQTMHENPHLNEDLMLQWLEKRFTETNFQAVKNDLEPFLHDPKELRFFEKEFFLQTLSRKN